MAGTREQADIERDIEVTREQLARSIGQLWGGSTRGVGSARRRSSAPQQPPQPRPSWGSSSTGAGESPRDRASRLNVSEKVPDHPTGPADAHHPATGAGRAGNGARRGA